MNGRAFGVGNSATPAGASRLPIPGGIELVEVEVFEYALEGGLDAVLVLRHGALVYAVFPTAPSQSTVEQVESLFGRAERRRIEPG